MHLFPAVCIVAMLAQLPSLDHCGCLPSQFIVLRGGTPSVPALLQHMMAFEPIGALVMNW